MGCYVLRLVAGLRLVTRGLPRLRLHYTVYARFAFGYGYTLPAVTLPHGWFAAVTVTVWLLVHTVLPDFGYICTFGYSRSRCRCSSVTARLLVTRVLRLRVYATVAGWVTVYATHTLRLFTTFTVLRAVYRYRTTLVTGYVYRRLYVYLRFPYGYLYTVTRLLPTALICYTVDSLRLPVAVTHTVAGRCHTFTFATPVGCCVWLVTHYAPHVTCRLLRLRFCSYAFTFAGSTRTVGYTPRLRYAVTGCGCTVYTVHRSRFTRYHRVRVTAVRYTPYRILLPVRCWFAVGIRCGCYAYTPAFTVVLVVTVYRTFWLPHTRFTLRLPHTAVGFTVTLPVAHTHTFTAHHFTFTDYDLFPVCCYTLLLPGLRFTRSARLPVTVTFRLFTTRLVVYRFPLRLRLHTRSILPDCCLFRLRCTVYGCCLPLRLVTVGYPLLRLLRLVARLITFCDATFGYVVPVVGLRLG